MTSIEGLTSDTDGIRVAWSDGRISEHLWIWLRDHSHDAETVHPDTHQRQLFTADIDASLRGDASVVGDAVVVAWDDHGEPPSVLPIDFLFTHRDPAGGDDLSTERVLWDAESILAAWPVVEFDAVMHDDGALRDWLELVARFGFCIVSGTPTTVEATESLARRVGYVRETIFGGMWDFQADLSKADTAYTNQELRPHTDGTYSLDAPGLQLLHCLAFDGTGGESTMVDGFRAAAQLRVVQPELYEVLVDRRGPGSVHRRRCPPAGVTPGPPTR